MEVDWESKLKDYSKEKLISLRKNALAVVFADPDSPKGQSASELLKFIDAEFHRRSLPGSIDFFLEKFPQGFDDPGYLEEERNYKLAASHEVNAVLTEEAFAGAELDPAPMIQEVKRLVNMTNLINASFEKTKLFDAIQDPKNSARFLKELRHLLHGEGAGPVRLERFADFLHTLGPSMRKWTYASYFLFLHDPKRYIFVKPEGVKKAIDISGFMLAYAPAPTAATYAKILAFGQWIDAGLRNRGDERLVPKDMIDTQSFIWVMAPTGKFER
ncbi:hypothetical protein [Pseudoxanthomonas winnipegensis]|uniref:hypothetical protein n=1 Tax=Pseudoxanthomonas winnipegensis TaxID=2480810 RepID=UPI0030F3A26F